MRIVIIDEPILSVFQEEFVKRYAPQEESPETMSTMGRSSVVQETTPSIPNSERNVYQSKRISDLPKHSRGSNMPAS